MTPRLPRIAACVAGAASALVLARLHAQVKTLSARLDALDRGVIEAGAAADQAGHRVGAIFSIMAEGVRLGTGGAPHDGEPVRPARLPAGHPESLVTALSPADEDELAELCTELWPNDEYLGITQDGPGAP